jgi:hypothetical protein
MVKKKVIIGILILSVLFLSGCVSSSNYIIRVTASPDMEFSGNYVVVSGGHAVSTTVDGIGGGQEKPIEYPVTGSTVSVAFQKKSERGTPLRVEILKNNNIVVSSSTVAAYGVVSVTTN